MFPSNYFLLQKEEFQVHEWGWELLEATAQLLHKETMATVLPEHS